MFRRALVTLYQIKPTKSFSTVPAIASKTITTITETNPLPAVITLKLRSLDKITLVLYSIFLRKLLNKRQIPVIDVDMPKTIKRITFLKSPHVNKKAMTQFQCITHRKIIRFKLLHFNSAVKFFFINKPKNIKMSVTINK